MNDAMTDRDKLYAWGLAQPFGGDRGSRRHISDFGRCIRFGRPGGTRQTLLRAGEAARQFRPPVLLTGDGAHRVRNCSKI